MPQQGKNLQVRRTQKLLREALIEERGFDTLTVGEIFGRAPANALAAVAGDIAGVQAQLLSAAQIGL